MDGVKAPKKVAGLRDTFSKFLRVKTTGVAPADDGVKKVKSLQTTTTATTTTDSPHKLSHSQPLSNDDHSSDGNSRHNKEALKLLVATLFASVSAIKAAYAQLQIAQSPYDPDCIHSADKIIIKELKNLSELKQCYLNKRILPSRDSQLSAEVREQENLIKTYKILVRKLQSQTQLKESETSFLKERLTELEKQRKLLEKRLNPNGSSISSLDNLHLSGLNPTHFIQVYNFTVKSTKAFVKLLIDEMSNAGWDLDAAAESILPNAVFSKPSHKILAFESYVCRKILAGFQEPNFAIPSSSRQCQRRWHCFDSFMHFKSKKAFELIKEDPTSPFSKFCQMKYLSMVHPKMEASFSGDLAFREQVSSGEFPATEFSSAFAEMARRVWLLHLLAFSFEPQASIFQVKSGCFFSDVYMQSAAVDIAGVMPELRPRVGFTVIPGFIVGKTVVQSTVYVSPSMV